ncbi:MAG: TRAP transporter substrate-binding protein DctP [Saccharospirillum sp.]|nr:TRAP transporter substrate-binding protein DctP [Saccharospirillum sp.]
MRLFLFTCLLALTGPVMADALKIATLYPPGSLPLQQLQLASNRLKERSDGRLSLQLYPGGVMGDDATVLRKVRIGQLHGALVSASTLSSLGVDATDLSQPFQFATLDAVLEQRKQFDPAVRQRLDDQGWLGFGPIDGGFSYLMSQNPVSSLQNLKSQRLWLPNTDDVRKMSQALSIDYQIMGIGDVLPALQTGALNSIVAPPSAALTLNWHSRVDYLTDQPVVYTWGMLVLAQRSLRGISEPDRQVLAEVLSEWADELDAAMLASNMQANRAIRQLLTQVDFSSSDLADIQAGIH